MSNHSALKLILLAGSCICSTQSLFAQTKYGDGGGVGGITDTGIVVGGSGGNTVNYGGQGGGMESVGIDPTVSGNGGHGALGDNGTGGAGGTLGGTIYSVGDPLPPFNSNNGENGLLAAEAGGGGGGALAIVNASQYTVSSLARGGSGGGGSDAEANGKARGGGGGGVAFILNGSTFTIAPNAIVRGGSGGAKTVPNGNNLQDEYGGGGGLGLILNSGTLEVGGDVAGGGGGRPLTAGDYLGGKVPEGSPGGGLYMKSATTVNILSTGSIATGTVETIAQKAPPAIILEGTGSVINNQGTIFRSFASTVGQVDVQGAPAIYILGDNNKVINARTILGNYTLTSGLSQSTALAIEIEGNQNTLELWGGQTMRGLVQVTSGTDNHFILGGDSAGAFNLGELGQINPGNSQKQRTGYLGFADFKKNGASVWTGSGVSAETGPWTIDAGTLALVDDGSLASHSSVTLNASLDISGITDTTTMKNLSGSASGSIILGSKTLALTSDTAQTFAGVASGAGNIQINQGIEIFTGNNTYTGLTSIANGAILQLGDGGTTGEIVGNASVDGRLTFNRSDDLTYAAIMSGTGSMQKVGAGVLTLLGDSSAFTGATLVDSGGLFVNGILGGTVAVKRGASLAGKGTIIGNTTLNDGAILIGQQGYTLTFNNDLSALPNTSVNVALGKAPNATSLFDVHGNLALNGVLNITDLGDFGPGLYRLFSYDGSFSGAGLTLGNVPSGADKSAMEFQNPLNQYNLYYGGGVANNMWDGGDPFNHDNGRVDGGDGVWDASNNNWTSLDGAHNGMWNQDDYAQFDGMPGTVTIADGAGVLTAQGLVFSTSGYVLDGGYLTLEGSKNPTIRVGDGSTASADMVATVAVELRGTQGMSKIDFGTLVLTGNNTYTGGTVVNGGTLQIGDGHNNGSILGNVVVNRDSYGHGTLVFDRADTVAFSGNITGGGVVVQKGMGTTIFAGNNNFSGGLTVESGTAHAGVVDVAFGSGRLTVNAGATANLDGFNTTVSGILDGRNGGGAIALDSGTLTLNQDFDSNFTGTISGTGGLIKNNSGVLMLSGANSYSGATTVNGGTLEQGVQGGFSGASSYNVGLAGTLMLNGYDTAMTSLANSGTVLFGNTSGTTLNVAGNYTGNNGTLVMNVVLNGDDSKTDIMKVGGDTSGITTIAVTNQGGLGAYTNEGIKIIDVSGQSNGVFNLRGTQTKDGEQSVVAGAYTYILRKNGISTPTDGDWYLRSTEDDSGPQYNPGTPTYEGYANTLQALNKLPTMQQRVGDRYRNNANNPAIEHADDALGRPFVSSEDTDAAVDNRSIWGRIAGTHNHLEANLSTTGMKQDIDTYTMQAGIDGQIMETEAGRLIGGFNAQYGKAKANITASHGDGSIDTSGWGFGGTMTWLGDNGLYFDTQMQAMWYDSNLNSTTADTILTDGNKGFGYGLSAEVGKRIDLDNYWSLTPQTQLTWSAVKFNTFNDAWGAPVSGENDNNLNVRLGISADYRSVWTTSNGQVTRANVYVITNLYQEFLSSNTVDVAGVAFDNANDKTWGQLGAGGTYTWADNKYALYGEGSINTSLNSFAESYSVNGTVGFRVRW